MYRQLTFEQNGLKTESLRLLQGDQFPWSQVHIRRNCKTVSKVRSSELQWFQYIYTPKFVIFLGGASIFLFYLKYLKRSIRLKNLNSAGKFDV